MSTVEQILCRKIFLETDKEGGTGPIVLRQLMDPWNICMYVCNTGYQQFWTIVGCDVLYICKLL